MVWNVYWSEKYIAMHVLLINDISPGFSFNYKANRCVQNWCVQNWCMQNWTCQRWKHITIYVVLNKQILEEFLKHLQNQSFRATGKDTSLSILKTNGILVVVTTTSRTQTAYYAFHFLFSVALKTRIFFSVFLAALITMNWLVLK